MMEEFEIVVPTRTGEYGRPYIAKITGFHPRFVFARTFISFDDVCRLPDKRIYTVLLTHKGIYESCIRYFDRKTGELITREREWFILRDGDEFSIAYHEISEALENFNAVFERCIRRTFPQFRA